MSISRRISERTELTIETTGAVDHGYDRVSPQILRRSELIFQATGPRNASCNGNRKVLQTYRTHDNETIGATSCCFAIKAIKTKPIPSSTLLSLSEHQTPENTRRRGTTTEHLFPCPCPWLPSSASPALAASPSCPCSRQPLDYLPLSPP